MTLDYLIFDASDDGEGTGTWEELLHGNSTWTVG